MAVVDEHAERPAPEADHRVRMLFPQLSTRTSAHISIAAGLLTALWMWLEFYQIPAWALCFEAIRAGALVFVALSARALPGLSQKALRGAWLATLWLGAITSFQIISVSCQMLPFIYWTFYMVQLPVAALALGACWRATRRRPTTIVRKPLRRPLLISMGCGHLIGWIGFADDAMALGYSNLHGFANWVGRLCSAVGPWTVAPLLVFAAIEARAVLRDRTARRWVVGLSSVAIVAFWIVRGPYRPSIPWPAYAVPLAVILGASLALAHSLRAWQASLDEIDDDADPA